VRGITASREGKHERVRGGYAYDTGGNLVQNGSINYTYDAENRLVWSSNGYEYLYDGDGDRVIKCTAGTYSTSCPSGSTGTLYWRYTEAIAESSLSGSNSEEYVFFNGKRVARHDVSTNAVHYYFSDHLGSHAIVENATGSACEQDIDYYPYGGQEHDYCTTPVAQNYKFTGKERDAESGLDNFGARYFASGMGRFMTPDWSARAIAVPYAVYGDPQSLNLYGYVRNDPVSGVDPDGHGYGDPPSRYSGQPGAASAADLMNEVAPEGAPSESDLILASLGFNPQQKQPTQTPTPTQPAQNQAQQQSAVPLKDDKGNVVNGANGNPALVPSNFDTKKVISAGQTDAALGLVSPTLSAAAKAKDLAKFRRGGEWDLQRLSGNFDPRFIDSATILIGMYAQSAGISQNAILSIENSVAKGSTYAKGTQMDSTYTNLPVRNVTNTITGMQLVQSGAISAP